VIGKKLRTKASDYNDESNNCLLSVMATVFPMDE
jgi:hypothetical protein